MDPYSAAERPGRATRLTDREAERDVLDRLVYAVRAGESRVLVIRGDPGVGKTVLLDYLAERARGCRIARATGVQSEMELAFAGLHQLCAPMLDHLDRIPVPQRDALRTALGLAAGPPPDRFLVGLAVLSLLSEVAGDQPLICLIDDEQWLDQATELTLGFVARRLAADPVALVFATRDPGAELAGQPELVVAGLKDDHARALLDSALAGPLDARVRDLIIAETRGNPLALLELPRGLTPAELAGGFGLPAVTPLTGRIEASFGRQLDALPAQTRRLLQLAAADPSGDRALVWRAAERLGIGVQAGAPAVEAGLVEFDGHVRFRHPLTRSAAYRSAPLAERQQLHAALAEVTDPQLDPDRRAWHLAQAAPDQDEDVAAELERSAGRAQARGGVAAAAAFLERAALLTGDPARRAGRALAAAQAKVQAGASGAAQGLLAIAETGPLSDLEQARLELVRARLASATSRDAEAPLLLLRAAERLEADRHRPGPRHLPGRRGGGDVRRPPGQPGRQHHGGGPRRRGGATAAGPAAPARSPARRPDRALQPGVHGRPAAAAAGAGRRRGGHAFRRGAALAVAGLRRWRLTCGTTNGGNCCPGAMSSWSGSSVRWPSFRSRSTGGYARCCSPVS